MTACPVFTNSTIVEQPANFLTLHERYTNSATSFIKQQSGKCSAHLHTGSSLYSYISIYSTLAEIYCTYLSKLMHICKYIVTCTLMHAVIRAHKHTCSHAHTRMHTHT